MALIMVALLGFAVTGYYVRSAAISQICYVSIVVLLTATLWITGDI